MRQWALAVLPWERAAVPGPLQAAEAVPLALAERVAAVQAERQVLAAASARQGLAVLLAAGPAVQELGVQPDRLVPAARRAAHLVRWQNWLMRKEKSQPGPKETSSSNSLRKIRAPCSTANKRPKAFAQMNEILHCRRNGADQRWPHGVVQFYR